MYSITTQGSARSINRKLQNLMTRQIPFAASKALNATGDVMLATNKREMKKQFSNPVRYTLNAFYKKPARYNDLHMAIKRKTAQRGKHYLEVQHKGGTRPNKRVETLLKYSLPYSGIVGAVLPTKHSQTRMGGMSMARVNEALGQIGGSTPQSSFTKARTRAAADKLAARKRPTQYFIGYREDGKNKTDGIYRRQGNRVQKMFHILEYAPKYRPNFPFFPPLIRNAKSYFPNQMRKQFRMAIRTQRQV